MEDITDEILEKIKKQVQHLQQLKKLQDQLTEELVNLEKNYDDGKVTQDELDRRLEVLVPRHERQKQEIASVPQRNRAMATMIRT